MEQALADRIKDTVNGKEIMSITVTLEDGTKVTIDHKTKKELLMYIGKDVELAILKKEFINKYSQNIYQSEVKFLENEWIYEREDLIKYFRLRLQYPEFYGVENALSIVKYKKNILRMEKKRV